MCVCCEKNKCHRPKWFGTSNWQRRRWRPLRLSVGPSLKLEVRRYSCWRNIRKLNWNVFEQNRLTEQMSFSQKRIERGRRGRSRCACKSEYSMCIYFAVIFNRIYLIYTFSYPRQNWEGERERAQRAKIFLICCLSDPISTVLMRFATASIWRHVLSIHRQHWSSLPRLSTRLSDSQRYNRIVWILINFGIASASKTGYMAGLMVGTWKVSYNFNENRRDFERTKRDANGKIGWKCLIKKKKMYKKKMKNERPLLGCRLCARWEAALTWIIVTLHA